MKMTFQRHMMTINNEIDKELMNLTIIIKLVELRTNVGDNGKSKSKY